MIVFHGSDHIVEHPVLNGGKRSNDYGSGFYTTESLELAKEWACAKNTDGFANRYELKLEGLSILNLNSPDYNILNWLACLPGIGVTGKPAALQRKRRIICKSISSLIPLSMTSLSGIARTIPISALHRILSPVQFPSESCRRPCA